VRRSAVRVGLLANADLQEVPYNAAPTTTGLAHFSTGLFPSSIACDRSAAVPRCCRRFCWRRR
jgi:hypothetical protein